MPDRVLWQVAGLTPTFSPSVTLAAKGNCLGVRERRFPQAYFIARLP